MIEKIFSWIKTISFFLVLMTIVLMVVPWGLKLDLFIFKNLGGWYYNYFDWVVHV